MKYVPAPLAVFVVCLGIASTYAQNFDDLRSIGNGIEVDAQGRVLPLSAQKAMALGKMLENALEPLPESLDRKVSRRTISLKKLDAQVKTVVDQYEVLPDAVRYLGGLTSIDYIIAVPEKNDLLLAGPAEGWRADFAGNIVGNQTGLPVLMLEDFLTVLRTWNQPVPPRTLACSIEPTQETLTKLTKLHQQYPNINANNADAYFAALEETYGDNPITITGVPASSRYARVLVAADYKMKQIALGLEPSHTRNISSYVSLISVNRSHISPQFNLVPEYAALTHDSKKLTWKLGNLQVRASSRATDRDPAALAWCRNLEENYDALVKSQPVFGELRNNMQFALAAALIHQENLLRRADCQLTILLDESKLKLMDHPIPKSVTYHSVKSQSGFATIVACGAVEISPVSTLRNNVRLDNRLDAERTRLIQATGNEWWSH